MNIFIKLLIIFMITFLTIASVSCGDEKEPPTSTPEANVIKVGVIGPMAYVQGKHHLYGAQMACDEINNAGGIIVGDKPYSIELIDIDSNEIISPTDAVKAMEKLITVDDVDFIVGGFKGESVLLMQDKAVEYKKIFLGCGASEVQLCSRVATNYDKYKYWFRISPVNGIDLTKTSFRITNMVAQKISALTSPNTPKMAIFAEKSEWANPLVSAAESYFVSLPPNGLGLEVVGTWRPSALSTDVSAQLSEIKDKGANIIYTIVSGPLGDAYSSQWGEYKIPAASVGINAEAQKGNFLQVTSNYGDFDTTLNTYADVSITEKTKPFYEGFVARFGENPLYTAGTYEALYILKDAIERADSINSDAVVTALEATDIILPAGRFVFMDRNTNTPHDVTWGTGYVTGVGIQWQEGKLQCVWPTAEDVFVPVLYDGTMEYVIPPWVLALLPNTE